MNSLKFIDLCQGNFGRIKMETDVNAVDDTNIIKVVGNSVGKHYHNRLLIDYLDRYYRGDQPSLYRTKAVRPEINNRVVENHALEIVRFMTAQSGGEPVQYVSRSKDSDKTANNVDALNQYMESVDKAAHDVELFEWMSVTGTAYRTILRNTQNRIADGDSPVDMIIPSPKDTYIIYSSKTGRPLVSVQQIKEDGKEIRECYTEKEWFHIHNSQIIKRGINGFLSIPIIEYPNNSRRLSDIEIVITMLDAINNMQCNRMDGVEQFVQAFMKFVNCEIDEETFLAMCTLGAIQVKGQAGVQCDVDLISKELNQEQAQISKDDVYKNMLIIEGMPNREQNTGGDTGQAVYLRNGWDFAEQRAKIDEHIINKSERDFLRIALDIIRIKDKEFELALKDVKVKVTRNKTDNMLVKTQALLNMKQSGIHPETALETCGLFADPEKVFVKSRDYLDAVFLTKQAIDEANKASITAKKGGGAIE